MKRRRWPVHDARVHFHAGRFDQAKIALEAATELRRQGRRRVIPLYDTATAQGYDFGVAPEGMWNEEEDTLLLEQIESGAAESPVAVYEDVAAKGDEP